MIPAFVLTLALIEFFIVTQKNWRRDLPEASTSLLIHLLVLAVGPLKFSIMLYFANITRNEFYHPSWVTWAILILTSDLVYYILHRLAHSVRFLWSRHYMHHTLTQMCMMNGFRRQLISLFWDVPHIIIITMLGFPISMALKVIVWTKLYQLFCHINVLPRGPLFLEKIIVTPFLHHIHHQIEPVGKNLGGVLIIWDRLFGTFSTDSRQGTYGPKPASQKIWNLMFSEDLRILSDIRSAQTWKERCRTIFVMPKQ